MQGRVFIACWIVANKYLSLSAIAISLFTLKLHKRLTKCPYYIVFCADFLDKFGCNINHDDKVLQWVKHEILVNNLNDFFGIEMLTDLNNNLCQANKDDMFDKNIFKNYAARILHSIYKPTKILKPKNNWVQINIETYKSSWSNKKLYNGTLGVNPC